MKRIFNFYAMCTALFCLVSCSYFDSAPVNPKIIGQAFLKLDKEKNLYFAEIDSVRYGVSAVIVEDHSPRSYSPVQDLPPVEGMAVTVFVKGKSAMTCVMMGHKTEAEIEEIYHTNSTGAVVLFMLMMLCLIGIAVIPPKRKVRTVRTE